MKIALVVPGGVDRSGTHRVIPCLLWLIERLVASGDEVHVFALQQETRPGEWPLLGARVRNAGARPRRLRAFAQLWAEHRKAPFDVVNGFWAGGPGVVAAVFGALARVPVVVTLPGGDLTAIPDIDYGSRLTRRGRFWTSLGLAGAAKVVVPSHWIADQAAALGVKAVAIPFGVALDRWPVRPPLRRTGGVLRLVQVANLNRVKDQETLLLAARRLRERGLAFRLDIVGQDTLDGAVQRRCVELGLDDRVHFQGFMPHGEVRRWIEEADIMLVTSRHEGMPVAAYEAAVAGVPTVGTSVGTIADWSPAAALAVPIGDSAAIAAAVERLEADENERLRLAEAAQAHAVAANADVTAQRTRDLYLDLLRGRGRQT